MSFKTYSLLPALLTIAIVIPRELHAQYCTGGGPSSTIDSNVESVQINGNSSSINYVGCPGITGLEDNTISSVDLTAGQAYTIDVQFGTCGNNYAGAGEVWIDFDGDGTFEALESIGTWSGTPPAAINSFNFTVPAGACNGTFRMRVNQQEAGALPLDPCAAFTWGSSVDFSVIISGGDCSFDGSGAGGGSSNYCQGGPSSTADSNVESVFLSGNTFTINHTGCPGVTGVQDLTSMLADLGAGQNYQLDVQFGTCGGNYGGSGEAWIDFDHSNTFDPGESIGTWTGAPPTALSSFIFNVPAGTPNGYTVMRIQQQENASNPLDPCANFTWGSVMDFGIEIVQGIDCSPYLGDDVSDAIEIPALPYVDTNSNTVCYTNQWPGYPSADVHYKLAVPAGTASITASLCNSDFDTYLTITDLLGNVVAYNDDASCGNGNSEITFSPGTADTLIIVVEGWGSNSGQYILNVSETGLTTENVNSEFEVTLYPNPAKDFIQISSGSSIKSIQLYSIDGQLVNSINCNNETSKRIGCSELSAGSYMIRLISEDGSVHVSKFQITSK